MARRKPARSAYGSLGVCQQGAAPIHTYTYMRTYKDSFTQTHTRECRRIHKVSYTQSDKGVNRHTNTHRHRGTCAPAARLIDGYSQRPPSSYLWLCVSMCVCVTMALYGPASVCACLYICARLHMSVCVRARGDHGRTAMLLRERRRLRTTCTLLNKCANVRGNEVMSSAPPCPLNASVCQFRPYTYTPTHTHTHTYTHAHTRALTHT
jgi:hypothetical protein